MGIIPGLIFCEGYVLRCNRLLVVYRHPCLQTPYLAMPLIHKQKMRTAGLEVHGNRKK